MATKKQARARALDARRRAAEMRQQEQAKERRRKVLVRAGVAVAVLAVGVGIAFAAVSAKSSGDLSAVKTYPETRNHVTTKVNYPQNPPAGGDHNPRWLNCGIYNTPVPNENAVHDLEHGAVWITYRPDLSATDVAKLTDIVKSKTRGYLDLSPYPDLPAPVVASAWGKQLKLKGANDKRLPKFIDKYQLGPQAPELGSACTSGVGTPTG